MKHLITLTIISLFFSACDQNKVTTKPGDKMFVATNFIKFDKKQEFENILLNEVMPSWYSYRDSVDEIHSLNQKAQNNMRIQKPVEMNQDSTWMFSMIADPFIDGANYSIIPPLRQKYGDEKAKEIYGRWNNCFSKQGQTLFLVEEVDLKEK